MKSLAKVAKRMFLTTNKLKTLINQNYYGKIDLIIKETNGRKYLFLNESDENKIYKKHLEEALLLKDKFEQAGWKFDYEVIDQVENGFGEDVEKGFMPKITYSSYIFAKSNLDEPINLIQNEEPLIDNLNDLWIYVASSILKNKLTIEVKIDDFGNIVS